MSDQNMQEMVVEPKVRKTRLAVVRPESAEAAQISPETLIAAGIEKGLSVEMMERLLAMRKELRTEIAMAAYDDALAAFQSECPIIEKTKPVIFNGKVQYNYAPFEGIIEKTHELLGKHGLSYSFKTEIVPDGLKATCILKHRGGYSQTGEFVAEMKGTNMMSGAQIMASKQTFAKRYAFCNVTGIVSGDEDNDGEKTLDEAKAVAAATQEQRDEIDRLTVACGMTKADVATRCREKYHVSITDITSTIALGIIDGLKLRVKELERAAAAPKTV